MLGGSRCPAQLAGWCFHNSGVQGLRVSRAALSLQPSRAQPGRGKLLGVQVVVGLSSWLPCIIPSGMNSALRVILWDAVRKGCAPCCAVVSVLVFLQMTVETAGQRSP